MIAVIYDPDTGIITNTIQGEEEFIAMSGAYLEVEQWRVDYDSKYMVKNGVLTEKTAEEVIAHAPTPPSTEELITTPQNYDPYA